MFPYEFYFKFLHILNCINITIAEDFLSGFETLARLRIERSDIETPPSIGEDNGLTLRTISYEGNQVLSE